MTREAFLRRFGSVFENRPDLAGAVWERGPVNLAAGTEGLHSAFVAVLRSLAPDALIAFLNEHPDLAAQSARREELTHDSQREQGSAGLDGLGAADGARLLELNRAYRERFGFPFIMAVKDRRPDEILAALEARLANTEPEERAEAIRQVERIMFLRLRDRLGEA